MTDTDLAADTQNQETQSEAQLAAFGELVNVKDDSLTIDCPVCKGPIKKGAKKCRHCGDYLDQGWTGLRSKTLWDVLGLLIVPLTLALIGSSLANMQNERQNLREDIRAQQELAIEDARAQRELAIEDARVAAQSTVEANRANANALQAYLDDMSAILLDEKVEEEKAQSTMRARTLSTISELDGPRNATVVIFLHETGLLNQMNVPDIDLRGADLSEAILRDVNLSGANLSEARLSEAYLSGANLRGADLSKADLNHARLNEARLRKANLSGADLRGADLSRANLSRANLEGANLRGANLEGADLFGADLFGADLSGADLRRAKLFVANLEGANLSKADLSGARYNAQTQWLENFDPKAAGAINIDEETE